MNRLSHSAFRTQTNLAGNLLVASPMVNGHSAPEAVVLLLNHRAEGATGVMLNSRENEEVRDWCRSLTNRQDKVAVLEQVKAAAQSQVEQHQTTFTVCMAQPMPSLDEAVNQLGTGVRLLVGQHHWRAGQLEREIATGLWLVLPAAPAFIFGDYENLWRTCVQWAGEQVIASAPGVQPHPLACWN